MEKTKLSFLLVIMNLFSSEIFSNIQWQASNYSQNSEPQKIWFENNAHDLNLKGHEDVLDIGCGDGKLTHEIAKRLNSGSALGIDISKDMIDFAQKTHKKRNLSFILGDAKNFNINKKFDLIVSFSTLHWVKEYEEVIKQAKEHLKPNGRIYFVFSTKYQYFPIEESLKATYTKAKWSPYFKNYHPGYYSHDIDSYISALVKHNFAIEEMSLKSKLNIFKTEKDLFLWLKAWLPHQFCVPKGLGDQFIHEFIEEYSKRRTKNTQGIHWDGFLLKVKASLNPSYAIKPFPFSYNQRDKPMNQTAS